MDVKTHIRKLKESAQLEFWIVTCFIALVILFSIIDSFRTPIPANVPSNASHSIGNSVITILYHNILVYIAYLSLVFFVGPQFQRRDSISNSVLLVFTFIAAGILSHIIMLYMATLLAIKIFMIYFSRNQDNKGNNLYHEAALLLAVWILLITFLNSLIANIYVILYEYYALPAVFIAYLFAVYRIIPKLINKRFNGVRYTQKMILVSLISGLLVFGLLNLLYQDYGFRAGFRQMNFSFGGLMGPMLFGVDLSTKGIAAGLTSITVLFFVSPISWNIYKSRHERRLEEIDTLKKELGKSDANLHQLKSQINPHFLFNALNTLYGTALQESAERTGEGIQKLGDMMRFMLQENIQDKIMLSRDVEYLKNYILLQKLRTSVSDQVIIQDQIEEQGNELQIAPMLLIPFVENAFKHGISLLNPSHIKITLQTKANTLYFDVHNSIHLKPHNDPEKGQSGIGLENVKQRLILLYPGRHELIIRENGNEFFIHLTIQLEETLKL